MPAAADESGSVDRADLPIAGERRRSLAVIITVAIWTIIYLATVCEFLVEMGANSYAVARIVGHAPACAFGAVLCLGLGAWLRQRRGSLSAAALVLLLASFLLAAIWLAASRTIFFPTARFVVEAMGWPVAVQVDGRPFALFWVALVFALWSAAWLAGTFADDLRAHDRGAAKSRSEPTARGPAAQSDEPEFEQSIWAPTARGRARLVPAEIICILAERDYVRIVSAGGREFLVRGALYQYLKRLDPAGFIQVHRGALVNLRHVLETHWLGNRGRLKLSDGRTVVVSRRFASSIRRWEKGNSPAADPSN